MKNNDDLKKRIKQVLEEYVESGHKTGLSIGEFIKGNYPDIYDAYLEDVNMTLGSLKEKDIVETVHFEVPRLWRSSKAVTETFENLDEKLLGYGVYVSRKAGKLRVELDGKFCVTFSVQEIDDQVEKTIIHDGKSAIISFEWTAPEDEPDELMELINGTFDGDASFSLRYGIYTVAEILEEYGIDPTGEEGKEVFDAFMDNVDFEIYGDFYRFDSCSKCDQEFKPELAVECVLQVLAKSVLCPKCAEKLP